MFLDSFSLSNYLDKFKLIQRMANTASGHLFDTL